MVMSNSQSAALGAPASAFADLVPPSLPWARREVVVASLTVNLLALALPLVTLQLYNRIIPNSATQTLFFLIAGLLIALTAQAVINMARSYLAGWAGARYEHTTSCAALDRLMAADLDALEGDAAGIHLDRLGAIGPMRDFYSGQAAMALMDLPFAILFIALLGFIGNWLMVVPVVLLAGFAVLAVRLGEHLRQAMKDRSQWDDRRYNFLIELLTGIHTVKGMAMEAQMLRRYERLLNNSASANYRVTLFSALAQGSGSVFSNLTMMSVASIGCAMAIAGNLSIGALAASTLLAGRTVQPIMRALGLWTQFQNIRLSQDRLEKLFTTPVENNHDGRELEQISGRIVLENVRFGYSSDGPMLFENVSLEIEPGEIIGLTGSGGAGKTSLMQLIMGHYPPRDGRVLIDGHDTCDLRAANLRQHIAYIPEHGVLFQGTVLDNLTMFGGDEKLDEAIEIATRLGLDQVFARLPAGLDTRVGDGATEYLPMGVVQRIIIARALVGGRRIILFDEASSSLDRAGDLRLLQTLMSIRGEHTIILSSQRPSLLRLANRVVELADGTLRLKSIPKPAPKPATAASASTQAAS